MDNTTFGKSKVALHLADHLNRVNNAKATQKISCHIAAVRKLLNDFRKMKDSPNVTLRTWRFTMNCLIDRVKQSRLQPLGASISYEDEQLALNLATNLLIGEIRGVLEGKNKNG